MIPAGLTRKQAIEWLIKNKNFVIDRKKSITTYSKPVGFTGKVEHADSVNKSEGVPDRIRVKAVVSTSNYFDLSYDVHIPGLWNKSLKETRNHYLLNNHVIDFNNVISDEVKVYTEQVAWRDLGVNATGTTEVLIYEAIIEKTEPTGMFSRYLNGKVKNHSVGMRPIKIELAVDNKDYEEYSVWKKYAPDIVNIEEAQNAGFFFAILEAKNIEGSAVVIGANTATPTLAIEATQLNEPDNAPLMDEPEILKTIAQKFDPKIKLKF